MGKHLKRLWGWASKFDTLQSIAGGWWWPALTSVIISIAIGVWSWLQQIPGPFIAVIVVVIAWFGAKGIYLIVSIKDRYREKTGSTDNPDTKAWEAIMYIAEESRWHDARDEYMLGAARELRREAIDGNLTIWGKRSIAMVSSSIWYTFSDVHTRIDKDYWMTHNLSCFPILPKGSNKALPDTIPEGNSDGPCYIDLMVNKRQVKRLWPRKRSIVRERFLR